MKRNLIIISIVVTIGLISLMCQWRDPNWTQYTILNNHQIKIRLEFDVQECDAILF